MISFAYVSQRLQSNVSGNVICNFLSTCLKCILWCLTVLQNYFISLLTAWLLLYYFPKSHQCFLFFLEKYSKLYYLTINVYVDYGLIIGNKVPKISQAERVFNISSLYHRAN